MHEWPGTSPNIGGGKGLETRLNRSINRKKKKKYIFRHKNTVRKMGDNNLTTSSTRQQPNMFVRNSMLLVIKIDYILGRGFILVSLVVL